MSIITDAKKGDNKSFELLIEEYKLYIYKTAKSILKNEDDVCDVIQETLISIYNNLKSLSDENYFKTWAIRITINKCYDLIRKNESNNKKNEIMKQKINIVNSNDNSNEIEKIDLENALLALDDDLRLVTVLYYYDDISVSDIANILKIPKGTIKSRLSRARKKLYEILIPEEVSGIE